MLEKDFLNAALTALGSTAIPDANARGYDGPRAMVARSEQTVGAEAAIFTLLTLQVIYTDKGGKDFDNLFDQVDRGFTALQALDGFLPGTVELDITQEDDRLLAIWAGDWLMEASG